MMHTDKTSIAKAGKPKAEKPKIYGVLIALAAFSTALYYAVMLPHMISNRDVDPQTATKGAAEIIKTAQQAESGILGMVASGTAAAKIVTHDQFNIPCRNGRYCLFADDGGQAEVPSRPRSAKGPHFDKPHWRFRYPIGQIGWRFETKDLSGEGVEGFGNVENLWVIALEDLPREMCRALNKRLGISGIPVEDDSDAAEAFASGEGRVSTLPGKKSACIDWRIPNPERFLWGREPLYVFYHVIEIPG